MSLDACRFLTMTVLYSLPFLLHKSLGGFASPRIRQLVEKWQEFWRGDTAIDEASRIIFPITYFSFVVGYFVLLTGTQDKDFLSRITS